MLQGTLQVPLKPCNAPSSTLHTLPDLSAPPKCLYPHSLDLNQLTHAPMDPSAPSSYLSAPFQCPKTSPCLNNPHPRPPPPSSSLPQFKLLLPSLQDIVLE